MKVTYIHLSLLARLKEVYSRVEFNSRQKFRLASSSTIVGNPSTKSTGETMEIRKQFEFLEALAGPTHRNLEHKPRVKQLCRLPLLIPLLGFLLILD